MEAVVQRARTAFDSGKTLDLDFRERQLKNLLRMYEENTEILIESLKDGLCKPRFEAFMFEVFYLIHDVKEMLKNFRKWNKSKFIPKNLLLPTDTGFIMNEPYGVALVIGAWNYPLQLSLLPVAGAIAAGNCVIIKPSEVSPVPANLIAELLPRYLDPDCYHVVQGGPDETQSLLTQRFDYIFYTGSTAVGKIVHAAATKNLVPTTLELGGKSPVYIDDSVDYETATKRILWGKCINLGQTCISPDYILCSKKVEDEFIRRSKTQLVEWYGNEAKEHPDLCRIVNDRHFNRLVGLLKNTKGKIVLGGESDPSQRWIAPTVVVDVQPDDPLMQEEIFGPIFPILRVENVQEASEFIRKREKPLALYIFSQRNNVQKELLHKVSSGGVCINDTIFQLTVDELPFGGVGASGMGQYHGQASFDTFSHKKSVCHRSFQAVGELLGRFRYPQYNQSKINFMKTVFNTHKWFYLTWSRDFLMFLFGVAVTVLIGYLIKASN